MEPFDSQDPLYKLLGKAKSVEPRGDFTQNVLRAVRQLPQRESLWEKLQVWCASMAAPRFAVAGVAVALMALVLWKQGQPETGQVPLIAVAQPSATTNVTQPSDSDVASELEGMDQLSNLLAQQDVTALTDSDIAFLLY